MFTKINEGAYMPIPKYWMISDRAIKDGVPTGDIAPLTYWVSDNGPLDNIANWRFVSMSDFKDMLVAAAEEFPEKSHASHEDQSHVTFFVHGYNNSWEEAARRYEGICSSLYSGPDSLGICISYDWPSKGSVVEYLADREHARKCAYDLAEVLSELFDWLIGKQAIAVKKPSLACKAKVSMISHSMGNYVLQKALALAWTRKNQPLLVSLINQLIMVAADVDNDLFESGSSDGHDGDAVANLVYRVTALYSGRDAVLGASAGLKHFGTRRLGRSGLATNPPHEKDNIWQVDCSGFFPKNVSGMSIHSAYFNHPGTLSLMRDILIGYDRSVLESWGKTTSTAWLQ
jgi:esterase/lipase superfamily enzyme